MINKTKYFYCLSFLMIIMSLSSFSQEEYIVNNSKFLQKTNSSYFGFNSLNKVGVLYNSLKINDFDKMDQKYFFGALSFENLDFSIGLDINSFKNQSTGFSSNLTNLSYIYKLQFDNNLFFLPSVTLGFGTSGLDPSSLIFEDQILGPGIPFGTINQESIDPLAPLISSSSYFDLGAAFIMHNEKFLAGLSLKHLNKPNTSFNKEVPFEKPIQVSVQGAYEFDLNPYERRFLPRYSYLYTYLAFTKFGESNVIYLSQDIQLGEFSFGLSQQLGKGLNGSSITNIGVSLGLAVENFDFGLLYNFPSRKTATETSAPAVFSPSIFELFITFDFSIYRRNRRGQYNRLTTDNYY